MRLVTHSEEETEQFGRRLAPALTAGDVLALTGDLGAGKTAFVRGLARGLGTPERVTSPTYTIVNEYLGGQLPLFHFDLYRLAGGEELFEIGWEEYLSRGGVCAVEWSERAGGLLPPGALGVELLRLGEYDRQITLSGARTKLPGFPPEGLFPKLEGGARP